MKIINIIRDTLCAIAILVILAAIGCFAFKIKPATVMSNSMHPTFEVGSVVFIDQKASIGNGIEIGDPIAFEINDNFITHRLVEEKLVSEGGIMEKQLVTKGDNVETVDPWPLKEDQVIGKVIFNIPFIGYLFYALSTRQGMIVGLGIVVCLILSTFLISTKKDEN